MSTYCPENEVFEEKSMQQKIADVVNGDTEALRDVTEVGIVAAEFELDKIRDQGKQIDKTLDVAVGTKTELEEANGHAENARKYSCAGRKLVIIGIIVSLSILLLIVVVVVILLLIFMVALKK